MIMVAHQTVGVNDNGKSLLGNCQVFQKLFFVSIVLEYIFISIPTVDYQKYSLADVIEAVYVHYEIKPQELSGGGRQRNLTESRAVVACLVRESENLSLTDLSKELKRDLSGFEEPHNKSKSENEKPQKWYFSTKFLKSE